MQREKKIMINFDFVQKSVGKVSIMMLIFGNLFACTFVIYLNFYTNLIIVLKTVIKKLITFAWVIFLKSIRQIILITAPNSKNYTNDKSCSIIMYFIMLMYHKLLIAESISQLEIDRTNWFNFPPGKFHFALNLNRACNLVMRSMIFLNKDSAFHY